MKTEQINPGTAARWLTKRPRGANKGDAGRVLVIAGSRDMAGAGVLCALGAARSGAGLVRLATVRSGQAIAARRAPLEATTAGLPEDRSGKLAATAWTEIRKILTAFRPTVVAVGPGLGRSRALDGILKRLLNAGVPLVIDADALNALADLKTALPKKTPAVLTPHPGEMARLIGRRVAPAPSERLRAAIDAHRRFGAAVLLKGAGTIITDGLVAWRNPTGNAAMASGGMGDVLTGVIAATWAQMPERTVRTGARAAAFGAFVHGLAGDIAVKKFPERTLLASDLAAALPRAFERLWRLRARGGRS